MVPGTCSGTCATATRELAAIASSKIDNRIRHFVVLDIRFPLPRGYYIAALSVMAFRNPEPYLNSLLKNGVQAMPTHISGCACSDQVREPDRQALSLFVTRKRPCSRCRGGCFRELSKDCWWARKRRAQVIISSPFPWRGAQVPRRHRIGLHDLLGCNDFLQYFYEQQELTLCIKITQR